MDKKAHIISIVRAYENDELPREATIEKIEAVSGKHLTAYTLDNYWRSEDLEDFAAVLALAEITDWETIDDGRALELIQEILADVTNEPILMRNAEALEKRYRKSSGTVMDYIFQDDISNSTEILSLLTKDTTINL